MSITGACKALILPLVSIAEFGKNQKNYEDDDDDNDDQKGGADSSSYLAYIMHMILFIAAGYLAWQCNASESTIMRVLYTIIASMFNSFYLFYYLIYRVLMGNACGIVIGSNII